MKIVIAFGIGVVTGIIMQVLATEEKQYIKVR